MRPVIKKNISMCILCVGIFKVSQASLHVDLLTKLTVPKVWFTYLRTFLHKRLNSTLDNSQSISFALCKMYLSSLTFNGLKERSKTFSLHQLYFPRIDFVISKLRFEPIVQCKHTRIGRPCQGMVYFNAHPKLRLNLTFENGIPTFGQLNCQFQHIDICENYYLGGHRTCAYSTSMRTRFCGFHPAFNFYPKSPIFYVNVYMDVTNGIILDSFEMSFMVIGKGFIHSYLYQNINFTQPIMTYIIEKQNLVLIYYIVVRKCNYININTEYLRHTIFIVYDGPATTTDILNSSSTAIVTSTFQCTVAIQGYNVTKEFIFRYFPVLRYADHIILIEKNEFLIITKNLPIKSGSNSQVFLINSRYHQVNITIMKLLVSKANPVQCTMGGVAIEEILLKRYEEHLVQCTNEIKSTYSSNSSLILTIYSYKKYSQTTVSLNISEIDCKAVRMDFCKLDILCSVNPILCSEYLKGVVKGVPNLYLEVEDKNVLNIKTISGACTVLQFSNSYKVSFRKFMSWAVRYPHLCRVLLTPHFKDTHINYIRFSLYQRVFGKEAFLYNEDYIDLQSRLTETIKYDDFLNKTEPVVRNTKGQYVSMIQTFTSYTSVNWLEITVTHSDNSILDLQKNKRQLSLYRNIDLQLQYDNMKKVTTSLMLKTDSQNITQNLILSATVYQTSDFMTLSYIGLSKEMTRKYEPEDISFSALKKCK